MKIFSTVLVVVAKFAMLTSVQASVLPSDGTVYSIRWGDASSNWHWSVAGASTTWGTPIIVYQNQEFGSNDFYEVVSDSTGAYQLRPQNGQNGNACVTNQNGQVQFNNCAATSENQKLWLINCASAYGSILDSCTIQPKDGNSNDYAAVAWSNDGGDDNVIISNNNQPQWTFIPH